MPGREGERAEERDTMTEKDREIDKESDTEREREDTQTNW